MPNHPAAPERIWAWESLVGGIKRRIWTASMPGGCPRHEYIRHDSPDAAIVEAAIALTKAPLMWDPDPEIDFWAAYDSLVEAVAAKEAAE